MPDNTSQSNSASASTSASVQDTDRSIRISTEEALNSDSRKRWLKYRRILRQNWIIPVLFLLVWAVGGFCILMRKSDVAPMNTPLWITHHTVKADYPYSYQSTESQQKFLPTFVGSLDLQKCVRNHTRLVQLQRRAFSQEEYSQLAPEELASRKILADLFNNDESWATFVRKFDLFQATGIRPTTIPYHFLGLDEAPKVFRIRIISGNQEHEQIHNYSPDELPPTPTDAENLFAQSFAQFLNHPELADAIALMIRGSLQNNINFSQQRTADFNRNERAQASLTEVKDGDKILTPSPDAIESYTAYRQAKIDQQKTWRQRLNILLDRTFILSFAAMGIFLFGFCWTLGSLRVIQASHVKRMILVSLFLIQEFLLVLFASHYYNTENKSIVFLLALLPLGYFPAMTMSLLDERIATCMAILMAILLPIQLQIDATQFRIFYFALFLSLAAIPCFRKPQRRMQFLYGGIIFGAILAVATVIFHWEAPRTNSWSERWDVIEHIIRCAMANGIVTCIACVITLPLYETIFQLASPMSLNELSDPNTPLLLRLRQETPGTYAHSMAVADLATNAAIAIGANAKLVNVMALYHDIGKLYAPRFFAENIQPGSANPHDRLTPIESAKIIIEHVQFGLVLAHKYHLSPLLLPAITQHHGNSLLSHFYQKAIHEAKEKQTQLPKEEDFRYTDSPPISKEVAIISIADACEAAVRALMSQHPDTNQLAQHITSAIAPLLQQKNQPVDTNQITERCSATLAADLTPAHSDFVKSIDARIFAVIQSKLQDHQLDLALLTTKELGIIRQSILDTILYKSHARPEYLR